MLTNRQSSRMKLHAKVSCSIKLAGPAASG
jgi:hypothetical protein